MAEERIADRRGFLKGLGAGMLGAAAAQAAPAQAVETQKRLLVWSCGGLAEAMMPAHNAYTQASGVEVVYTGAFAAALGKSLLTGAGETEVFAGRVLELSKKLRASGKMLRFRPLCFTSYGIAVRKDNPANIKALEDLTRKGVRVAMAPQASPPGGQAILGILKKAQMLKEVMANVLDPRATCVQRTVMDVVEGRADAMIVEARIPRMSRFAADLAFLPIPEALFPPAPLTFTAGVMATAKNPEMADAYVAWLTGAGGQPFFEAAGFIHASTPKGQELVEKLGVKDA